MATNDIWRLSCLGLTGSDLGVITLHVRMKSPGGTFAGAAEYIKTNLLTLLKGYQSNSFSWTGINGNSVNLTPPQSLSYSTGFPLVGAENVSDAMPLQIACVTKLQTAYAGRSYRGRVYIPGMSEGHCAGSQFSVAMQNAYQTYWDDLVAALGSGGSSTDYELGVYSRKLSVFTPVTSAVVRRAAYTQRRRTAGEGA